MTLYDTAARFFERLIEVKSGLQVPFEWYPYNTLANAEHLERLLDGGLAKLQELIQNGPVLDLGCGDGEWSFFLESLGCGVDAVDCPVTNHNAMAGVRALKEALGSKIEIHAADLDGRFSLPAKRYQAAFFFGTLYHLKNPFYVLGEIARAARYCFLSTRIADTFHPRLGRTPDLPLAYLLGAGELNADDSNFWIFSRAGLERLLRRTHFEIVSSYSMSPAPESTPWSLDADERMFCLAESTYGLPGVEFLEGWHQPEDSGWRWTEQRFTAHLEPPRSSAGSLFLRMDVYVPGSIALPLRLSGCLNGEALAPDVLDRHGYHSFLRPVRSPSDSSFTAEFQLDKALPPDEHDRRERGLIVASLRIERR